MYIAVNCGTLSDPVNGRVDTSSGTAFRAVATYTCNTGYILDGSSRRTCGANKQWNFVQPTCKGILH